MMKPHFIWHPCALLLLLGCFAGGLLPPPTTHAQLSPNWPPVGTKWVYHEPTTEELPGKPKISYITYVENACIADTMVNNIRYGIVQSYIRLSTGLKPYRIYGRYLLRVDSHRVYMRGVLKNGQVSNESIIQDYSLNNGDTLIISDEVFYTWPVEDSVIRNAKQYGGITMKSDTVINGTKRRKYYLDYIRYQGNGIPRFSYNFTFIEGVGPLETASAYYTLVDPEIYTGKIQCYIEPGKMTVHFRSDTNCFFVDSSKWVSRYNELEQLGLEFYPNPASENLTIKGLSNSSNLRFELLSTTGQTITLSEPFNERLALPSVPTGVYLLQIKDIANELLYATKLVIL